MSSRSGTQDGGLTRGERYEQAAKVLDGIFTPAWRDMKGGSSSQAGQDFGQICVEHCYADAWGRNTLDFKTRSIITLSALAAKGNCQEELKLHVRAALSVGHTPDDIVEFFIHLIPYVGVPVMTQAMRNAREVFAQAARSEKTS